MLSLFKIGTVAFYENKILLRSWFFRIFAILTLLILVLVDNGLMVFNRGIWMLRGISAGIPYLNLMILNLMQGAVVVFLASDFLKYDRKLDTTSVVYMRSMSNADYVFGKTLGVLSVFIILNLLVLTLTWIMNYFFIDVNVSVVAYILYPMLICVPTLVFMMGLSFLMMATFRSQAVTFILLLGYLAMVLFFIGSRSWFLFDSIGFYLPMMYSEFIGFGDAMPVLLQRGMYLLLGTAGIFATIPLIQRLPQTRTGNYGAFVIAILMTVGAVTMGVNFTHDGFRGRQLRQEMQSLNIQYATAPAVSVTDADLDLTHTGSTIAITANLTVRNDTNAPIDSYLFSLNPGLEVTGVANGTSALPYQREAHLLHATPGSPLPSGGTDVITITYAGTIDEEACYVDIPEETRNEPYRLFLYNIDKRYAIVSPQVVLLTPENLWYPVPGIPYGATFPEIQARNFMNTRLTVHTSEDLQAISQGVRQETAPGEFVFTSDVPFMQISLAMAKYKQWNIAVDDTDYNLFVLDGNDYFTPFFTDITTDAITEVITNLRLNYETRIGMDYPFNRFSMIETPIQFFTYERAWTLAYETTQPEQSFLPEKGLLLNQADFKRTELAMSQGRGGPGGGFGGGRGGFGGTSTQTPAEAQETLFNSFLNGTLLSDNSSRQMNVMRGAAGVSSPLASFLMSLMPSNMPSYDVSTQFYAYSNHVSDGEWPLLNVSIEYFLKSLTGNINMSQFMRQITGLSNEEMANRLLAEAPLDSLLVSPEHRDMLAALLQSKSNQLFASIKSLTGDQALNEFLYQMLPRYRFQNMPGIDFLDEINWQFGVNLLPIVDEWDHAEGLPAFSFSGVDVIEVTDLVANATRYQVVFDVYNPEPVGGVFSLEATGGRGGGNITGGFVMMGGGGGRGGGGMMGVAFGGQAGGRDGYYYRIEAGQAKRIGVLLDSAPGSLNFNTYISKNIPNIIAYPVTTPRVDDAYPVFDGQMVLSNPPQLTQYGEIIVDNDDPGFSILTTRWTPPLQKLFASRIAAATTEEDYTGMNLYRAPADWRLTSQDIFYGLYQKTAYYKKSGNGDSVVRWTAEIPESDEYAVYAYTPNMANNPALRMGGGRDRRGGGDAAFGRMEFLIHHDDGTERILVDMNAVEEDWSYLGTFYLSAGTASVDLTDDSDGQVVFADAIKWVLQSN